VEDIIRVGRAGSSKKYRTVIIREIDDTEVLVTLARVVPEREAWLLGNPKAKALVMEGLEQARAGQFVQGPDLKAGEQLAGAIEGDGCSS
jgi:hypothetical protein